MFDRCAQCSAASPGHLQCCSECPTIVHVRPLSMPDHCPCSTIVHVRPLSMRQTANPGAPGHLQCCSECSVVHVRPLSMPDHCPCPTIVHARPLSISAPLSMRQTANPGAPIRRASLESPHLCPFLSPRRGNNAPGGEDDPGASSVRSREKKNFFSPGGK